MATTAAGRSGPLNRPAVYRIRVAGRMDDDWSDRLEGMVIRITEDKDGRATTELTGQLADQAALMGVLQQLENFRIPVLSVECVDAEAECG